MSSTIFVSSLGWVALIILILFLIWYFTRKTAKKRVGATLPAAPPYSPQGTMSSHTSSTVHLANWVTAPATQSRGTQQTYTLLLETDRAGASTANTTQPKAGAIVFFRLEFPEGENCTVTDITSGATKNGMYVGYTDSSGNITVTVEIDNKEGGKPFVMKVIAEEYVNNGASFSRVRGINHDVNVDN